MLVGYGPLAFCFVPVHGYNDSFSSSSASETIFALAAFAGFSSEVIVRRLALVPLKLIVLCWAFVCPIGPETLRRLAAGMFTMASNMFKSTG